MMRGDARRAAPELGDEEAYQRAAAPRRSADQSGTVATRLSQPFAKAGLDVRRPSEAANRLLAVLDQLTPEDSGGFFDYSGARISW